MRQRRQRERPLFAPLALLAATNGVPEPGLAERLHRRIKAALASNLHGYARGKQSFGHRKNDLCGCTKHVEHRQSSRNSAKNIR